MERPNFIPLKRRFNILSSPPSSDDEGDFSSEPTFAPPPPYKQQAVSGAVDSEVRAVADGYNRTTGRGKTTRIPGVRSFNNWVKGILINAYCPEGAAVLDICGGRGGDLHKFRQRNISFLVLADNAEESVVEAERRYQECNIPFPAYFICEDCLGVDICRGLPQGVCFDLVNCQFALHYSFRNEESARTLLANVSSRLRPGSYFIGTTVDDRAFLERLRMARGARHFGNSLYRVSDISFECENFADFGSEYTFYLEESIPSIKEYLVPFGTLERLAREYGLRLVCRERFSSELQGKFKVEAKMPTMGREEWEICSLYCVFVFVKVPAFGAQGKVALGEKDIKVGTK